ncbi:potassium/proton antiporter [Nitriliruptoraceae bacterium ZYF776]|nr:potassium/proton antiporter [Profundirhabdus halotolerans]
MSIGVDQGILVGSLLALAAIAVAALGTGPRRRFRVPGALLFLGLGMLIGSDGLAVLPLDDAALVQNLSVIALLFILLEGGLTTKPTDLRLAALPGLLLATVGVLVTAGITAAGAYLLSGVDLATAALLGAVVASTDAAAVFATMRTTPLPRRLSALLRVESGSNDPIAVMLTVGLLAVVTEAPSAGEWIVFALRQLVGGVVIGVVVAVLGVAALRRADLGAESMYALSVAALGGLSYATAASLGSSGFLAVYVTGLVIGALMARRRRAILGFHEAVANASEIGLFLLLGLLVFPSELGAAAPEALLVALVLTVVARPAAVWLCTVRQGYRWPERVVTSVAGLKGAVPIVLATFPLTAGVAGAEYVFHVVFFVVLLSVLGQGLALPPLIARLGLEEPVPAWAPVAETLPLQGIDIDVVEVHVHPDLPIVGATLAGTPPPSGTVVMGIVRGARVRVPRGGTKVRSDDVLLLTVDRNRADEQQVTAWARGEHGTT